jgi:hypothetical protein
LVKKLPTFYGTPRFITVVIDPSHEPEPEPDESSLHPDMLLP